MESKYNKSSFILAGAITAVIGSGLFYLYKQVKRNKLNSWLDEYIEEVDKKIKSQSGGPLSLETIANIINLVTEIEDYLYYKDYSHVEQARMDLLKKEGYEVAVVQSIELHEKTFNRAKMILQKRLNVNLEELKEIFTQQGGKTELKDLLEKTKRPYLSIPVVDKDTVKNAYIYHVAQLIQYDKVDKNNQQLVKIKPEFREMAMHIYYINKYIAKDTLMAQYGLEDKYFPQLLTFHNLLEDKDIKLVLEELKNL